MDRRTFTLSSLAAAGAALSHSAMSKEARPAAAVIGCGWFGGVITNALLQESGVEFVTLCDPNAQAIASTQKLLAGKQKRAPRVFADYRRALDSRHHDIVIVATPDHWHALPAIAAMQRGADVFLEKPVSVDVTEGEALLAAARKYKRIVQINTHRRSNPHLVEARDKYLTAGRIGKLGLVETYSYISSRPNISMVERLPPSHLDYELWTGPAPMLSFREGFESRSWRGFKEYGNGQIGDLGVHAVDCVRWMLSLGWPTSISSHGGIYVEKASPANISDTQYASFQFPDLEVTWQHRTWGVSPMVGRHWTDLWGANFIGDKGTLKVTMLGYEFMPAGGGPKEGFSMLSKTGDLENLDLEKFPAVYGPVQRAHVADFLRSVRTRERPVADIEEGHISTACCILANLSDELGRPLRYDPKTRSVIGDPEATQRLTRAYRSPWMHPDPVNV